MKTQSRFGTMPALPKLKVRKTDIFSKKANFFFQTAKFSNKVCRNLSQSPEIRKFEHQADFPYPRTTTIRFFIFSVFTTIFLITLVKPLFPFQTLYSEYEIKYFFRKDRLEARPRRDEDRRPLNIEWRLEKGEPNEEKTNEKRNLLK